MLYPMHTIIWQQLGRAELAVTMLKSQLSNYECALHCFNLFSLGTVLALASLVFPPSVGLVQPLSRLSLDRNQSRGTVKGTEELEGLEAHIDGYGEARIGRVPPESLLYTNVRQVQHNSI